MSIQHTTRERSIELQGEIKRARDVVAECEASEHEHQRALENAQKDTVAAKVRLAELLDEQKQLAQQAHDEVMGNTGADDTLKALEALSWPSTTFAHNSQLPEF